MAEHFRCYVAKKFRPATLDMIYQANAIIQEYGGQGLSLTLRQLYYQFVARGVMTNNQANYNKLGEVINDGRLAGLVSWEAIEDRTRNLMGLETFSGPGAAVRSMVSSYRRDLWAGQENRPEVWVEKEAMVGSIQGICNQLRVDFFACRGYNSQSEQWRAGQRFSRYVGRGQRPIVIHLGDHDPSGIDMTRDNRERLSLFAGVPVVVIRLALNMDQIEELRPPPNPAKQTDSRFEGYRRQFGDESWELDALPPDYVRNMIDQAVARLRSEELWQQELALEVEERQVLFDLAYELGGSE